MTGFFGPIEQQTLKNGYFRQVLFTGKYCQLVVMCLQPGEEIVPEPLLQEELEVPRSGVADHTLALPYSA